MPDPGPSDILVRMNFWQANSIQFSPWGADYDLPVAMGEPDAAGNDAIDFHAEARAWEPYCPQIRPALPDRIILIDGRLRVDAPFVGRQGNVPVYGAFATIAIGAVAIDRTRGAAVYPEPPIVRRAIAFCGEKPPVTRLPALPGMHNPVVYDLRLSDRQHNDPDRPQKLVLNAMRTLEIELAGRWAREPDTLAIQDGNLVSMQQSQAILGYVKTLHKAYLAGERAEILWQLQSGERTPVFALGRDTSPNRRWSWYLRSGDVFAGRAYRGLHGVVRLELLATNVARERAIEIADWSCELIPRYASQPLRDPRAPQNLMPIGALEKHLGRSMGDRKLVRRCIQAFLAARS
ncbi:hypothetical protein KR51_00020250 [Rubidibacter lacunae KORDI 51-2]|uniref:NurA domain protein n=1 Tax=Rubidibacter lacunae KORDI 51-2 TaxID=582515 RepID=U5DIF5_9CHRO|nr:hypothetical protein [Rubidibacter lacunae]ERN41451.1 hypothetical protein KR51_00020250 [Rubidibacter lacunae KORDI 51-2]